jgi:hypothetical protein
MSRVRLQVPAAERWKCSNPQTHGEHFGHDGRSGVVLCGAGSGGAWVRFDGQAPTQYVGVPLGWLTREDE